MSFTETTPQGPRDRLRHMRANAALAALAALSLSLPACGRGLRDREVELTWRIHPAVSESDGGPRRDVEVVARIGDAVHRVALGPHDGVLVPSVQSACDPSLKNATEVSTIRFLTMGPETIVARRVRPALLEISFTVDADDEPAKTAGTLGAIPIPVGARVTDAIVEIVEGGEERPIDCSSATPL